MRHAKSEPDVLLVAFSVISFFSSKIINEFLFVNAVGYSYLVGLSVFILLIAILSYVSKNNFLDIVNGIAPYIPLMHFFGRIACFFAGCCYGISTELCIGVIYHTQSVVFQTYGMTPSHPVQIYEAILNFIIYFIISKRINFKYRFAFYCISYGVVRFVLEFFRFDKERGNLPILTISPSQLLSGILIGLGCAIMLFTINKNRFYQ